MSSKNASSDDAESVTSGISASAGGLSSEEKAQRKAERQRRIEAQMRAMEDAMMASRSAVEVMKSDFNDDGGGSVSSLGSGRTESTRGGGVRDEEAPGPLPASSIGLGTSQRRGSTTDKFMESKTWGMDSAAVDMAAPRLSGATESARKFLWNDDEEGAEDTGTAGASVPGLEKGGIFSPSSRNLSSIGAASSTSQQENAVDLTIDQVFGSGEALSSTGTQAASRRGPLLSRLRLGALAWGEDAGEGGNESMKSINLAPRGSESDNLRNIQAGDTDYDNEKGHGRRISARIGSSASVAGTATKDWCVDHRRLVGVIAVAAVVIGSVLLVGQNGGFGPAERGIGFPSLPSFGFSKGGADRTKRLKAIKSAIINAEISYAEDFEDSDSPQSRSLDWIANHDEAELDTTDPFILQRYSLMVLWFGTGYTPVESRKKNQKGKQGKDQEEEEELVVLEEIWKSSDGWATSRGICSWYGVTCHHRPGYPLTETTYNDNNGVTTLRLPKNNLRGTLSREIFTGLRDLVVLELQENVLSGKLYTDIGNLKRMEYLKLESNFLTGTIPPQIGLLQELEHIQLGYNNFIGSIPESIGGLAELRALGLYHNSLTSTIPSSIGKNVNLFELYLDSNSLTGEIPPTIAALTELTDLRLRRNQLSGPLPPELGNMKSLSVLYLDANQISGTIPATLNKLSNLRELSLYKNVLTGRLPDFNQLIYLSHFYGDHNQLTGFIPSWNLPELRHLFLYNNKLSGRVPDFDGMPQLEKLRADGNALTGSLPSDSLIGLTNLEELVISDNQLKGTISTQLGTLEKLGKLILHGNGIAGNMPEEVCALTRDHVLDELEADCGGIAASVQCDCCTKCH